MSHSRRETPEILEEDKNGMQQPEEQQSHEGDKKRKLLRETDTPPQSKKFKVVEHLSDETEQSLEERAREVSESNTNVEGATTERVGGNVPDSCLANFDEISEELEINKINFMKIDVEGFESDVLRGASGLLQNKKIDYILFEIQDTILRSINKTSREVFQLIIDAGYQIIDLNGNPVVDSNSTETNGDYLACLDGKATANRLAHSDYKLND